MRRALIVLGLAATAAASATVLAQGPPSWVPPSEKDRCPSKWGAGDERGAGNHKNPPP